jgi:hypothetical protein
MTKVLYHKGSGKGGLFHEYAFSHFDEITTTVDSFCGVLFKKHHNA